jgi:hypothetical protein
MDRAISEDKPCNGPRSRRECQCSILPAQTLLVPLRFGDPVVIESSKATVRSAAVVGPRTRSARLRFGGSIDQVNVSFFPGVAGAFVGLPIEDLVGRVAAPDDVWPHHFREALVDQVNLSMSQLERSFTRQLGVGPKFLARQTRLAALAGP